MNEKIRPDHLERAAYVSARQTSVRQFVIAAKTNNDSPGVAIARANSDSFEWS